jgi:hypothetical protein
MAKTTGDSLKIEVWGSDRVAQGASALVDPSQSTIEKGFVDGIASANDFTWVPNILGAKVNHCLQNGVATWNNTTAYVAGNMVTHAGKAWQCLLGNTNSTPADGNANWDKISTASTPPTANSILPSQTGNSGKFLTTNGTNASWGANPFATMNADFSTLANLAGTYSRTGTLVTVSATAHGHITGHSVYVDFLTGGALDGWYDVTYVDANTFTLNTVASGTIAGGSTLNLLRNSTRAVNGFTNFLPYEAGSRGYVFVPFSTLAPTANYTINCTAGGVTYLEAPHIGTRGATFINPTTAGFYMSLYSGGFSSGNVTPPYVHIEVNA